VKKLTAAQHRYLDNATLITASKLVFQGLEKAGTRRYLLSEIADTTSGGTPSRKNITYYGGAIPWIKSGELNDGLIEQAEEYITEEGLQKSSAKIYPKGTLVIALYGATVGKTGILNIDAASNQAVCAVTPKIKKDVSNRFLFWFLRSKRPEFLNISFGGAQPNISQKILRETSLPIPTLQLQKQICEFLEIVEQKQVSQKLSNLSNLPPLLSNVREAVTQVEELVAKVEEARGLRSEAVEEASVLVRSASSHVFSSDEAEFSSCPIGEVINFRNDLIRPIDGKSGSLRFIGLQHIESHTGKRIGEDRLMAEELTGRKFKFSPGEIVYGYLRPYLNKVWVADCEGVCSVDQYVIQPESALVDVWYLAHFMKSQTFLTQAIELTHSLILPRLRTALLGSISIPLPPLSEQCRIVTYLDYLQAKVDTLKQLQSQTEAELNALLPSILDKAFKEEL